MGRINQKHTFKEKWWRGRGRPASVETCLAAVLGCSEITVNCFTMAGMVYPADDPRCMELAKRLRPTCLQPTADYNLKHCGEGKDGNQIYKGNEVEKNLKAGTECKGYGLLRLFQELVERFDGKETGKAVDQKRLKKLARILGKIRGLDLWGVIGLMTGEPPDRKVRDLSLEAFGLIKEMTLEDARALVLSYGHAAAKDGTFFDEPTAESARAVEEVPASQATGAQSASSSESGCPTQIREGRSARQGNSAAVIVKNQELLLPEGKDQPSGMKVGMIYENGIQETSNKTALVAVDPEPAKALPQRIKRKDNTVPPTAPRRKTRRHDGLLARATLAACCLLVTVAATTVHHVGSQNLILFANVHGINSAFEQIDETKLHIAEYRLKSLWILYRKGLIEEAVKLLEPMLISKNIRIRTSAEFYSGMMSSSMNRLPEARSSFERALANYRDLDNQKGVDASTIWLGEMDRREGDIDSAETKLASVQNITADYFKLRKDLAFDQGLLIDSIEWARAMASIDPKHTIQGESSAHISRCYFLLGDMKQGRSFSRKAQGHYLEAEFDLGLMYNRVNDYLESILEGDPDLRLRNYLVEWAKVNRQPHMISEICATEYLTQGSLNKNALY